MRKTKKLLSVLLTLCMVASLIVIGTMPASADNGGYASQIVNGALHMEAWIDPGVSDSTVDVDRSLYSSYTFNVTFRTYTWYYKNGYPYNAKVVTPDGEYYMWYTYGQVSAGVNTVAPTVYNGAYFDNNKLLDNATSSVSYNASAPAVGATSGPYSFKTVLIVFDSDNYAQYVTIEATRDVYLRGVCNHSNGYTGTSTDASHFASAATCTSPARYYYSCTTCGANGSATFTSGSAQGHDFSGAYHNVSSGTHNRKCSRCSAYGLNGTENATENCSGGAATCTAQPVCYYCGNAYGSSLGGHVWNYDEAAFNWNGYECATATVPCTRGDDSTTVGTTVTSGITTPPTCEGEGVRTYTASFTADGHTYTSQKTETVQPLGHNYNGAYHNVAPGSHNQACERFEQCGTYGVGQTKDAAVSCSGGAATCTSGPVCDYCRTVYGNSLGGHIWDYANATFNWNGYACPNATVKCTNDAGHSLSLPTSVTNKVTTQPTCIAGGVRTYTASFTMGGQNYTSQKTEPVDPTGVHSYTVYVENVPATCSAKGYDVYKCATCTATENRNYTEGFDATNHVGPFTAVEDVPATCVTPGRTGVFTCDACGQTSDAGTEVPATNVHSYTVFVENVPATCSAKEIGRASCRERV